MHALALLAGDARAFCEEAWASRVHLHHGDPDALTALLSFDDVDRLLTSTAIRTPAVRLARDGAVLPASSYTRHATLAGQPLSGLVDARKVIDAFEDGATVVLQGLHRYWQPLTALVSELELALGHPCQANAYLTPPGSQGFAVHRDSHDVFVFQTHGSKLWEVHPAPGEADSGESPRSVRLEPGLSMYLPTGTPHAARAEGGVSLHVTVGINQLTWQDLVDQAVRRATDSLDPELRLDAHLPAGYLEHPDTTGVGLGRRLSALAEALRGEDPDEVVGERIQRFLRSRNVAHAGGLVDRMALKDLGSHTALRRRPGRPCVVRDVPGGQDAPDRILLLLGDREVSAPGRIRSAVETILRLGEFTPADLPMDDQSNLVLCRRLVREGLLEVRR